MNRPVTINDILGPFWTISRILGLSNRKLSDNYTQPKFKEKIYGYVHNVIMICIMCCSIYRTAISVMASDSHSLILQFSDCLMLVANNVCFCLALVSSMVNQEKYQEISRAVQRVADSLRNDNSDKEYKRVKIIVGLEMAVVFAITLIYCVYYNFITARTRNSDKLKLFLWWMYFYLSPFVIHVYLMLFVTTVLILRQQCSCLNRYIKNVHQLGKVKTATLIQYKNIFLAISTIQRDLNRMYSLMLLAKFFNQFIYLFCFFYYIAYGYSMNGVYIKPNTAEDYLIPIGGSLTIFIEFVTVVIVCENMSAERKKTGKIIHTIPCSSHLEPNLCDTVSRSHV